MDDPTPLGGYLGCTHWIHTRYITTEDGEEKEIAAIEYDMQGQLEQALEVYKQLTGIT